MIRNNSKIMMASSVHVWTDTRIFFKEAQTLASNGFQVSFYAIDFESEKSVIPNLKMTYLKPVKRWQRVSHWKFLYKEMLKSDAKHFHFHDPELLLVARKLKRKVKNEITITYDMHEHIPAAIKTKQWIPTIIRKPLAKLITVIEKKLMRNCDTVIFAEKSYKDNYEELLLQKVDVLNYPVFDNTNWKKQKQDCLTLVYVGVLTEQRGIYNMLELAVALKAKMNGNFRMNIIGPIFTDEATLNAFIQKHQLEENVTLYGRMQYKDIWNFYQQADIGLCLLHPTPNNLNSHSTKLFEYMAAELPIIATDFPDFIDILTTNNCGKTGDIFNAEVLADLVLEMDADKKMLEDMGRNGRVAFDKFYNWKNEEKKLIAIYK